MAEESLGLTFLQISDSHVGFDKPANPNALGTLEEAVRPDRTALLVYDMQVGIVRQIADGARVLAQVQRALDAARTAGMRVFFSRHMSLPVELMGASQFRMAMAWQRVDRPELVKPWFLRDSPGFALDRPAAS